MLCLFDNGSIAVWAFVASGGVVTVELLALCCIDVFCMARQAVPNRRLQAQSRRAANHHRSAREHPELIAEVTLDNDVRDWG